jgi:hypothetical protein
MDDPVRTALNDRTSDRWDFDGVSVILGLSVYF